MTNGCKDPDSEKYNPHNPMLGVPAEIIDRGNDKTEHEAYKGTILEHEESDNREIWTVAEVKKWRMIDRHDEKNSLRWILPVARELLRHMDSDELENFIIETMAKKHAALDLKCLSHNSIG